MEGYIKSIKYRKLNKYEGYFLVTIINEKGVKIGTFGSKEFTSPVEFRKETFGIMAALDTFDLLKIGSRTPNKLKVYIKDDNYERIYRITNQNGMTFTKDQNNLYIVKRNIIKNLFNKENQSNIETIESIKSISDTFTMLLTDGPCFRFYVTGDVYYGFGYPLLERSSIETKYVITSSLQYLTYMRSILKLYGTNDLMNLSLTDEVEYKKITYLTDESGRIIGIGNKNKNIYLISSQNTYELLNEEKLYEKKLKLK